MCWRHWKVPAMPCQIIAGPGACGECKAKVCSGEIDQGFVLDMALPQEERERGLALMCMARPKSDVIEIEYGTDSALPQLFPPQENLPYIVTDKRQVTPKIIKLRMRSLGEPMRFWPGQYIQMGNPAAGVPSRAYSIANIPNQEGELILFVTKLPGEVPPADGSIHQTWCQGKGSR